MSPNLDDKVKSKLEEIEREAQETSDPELYKLRLLSKLERSTQERKDYREG